MNEFRRDCARCGHSSDWHSFKDGVNGGSTNVTSPDALFSCNGPRFGGCARQCPDFIPPLWTEEDRVSSADLHRTLAAIDAATGCQQCGKPLGSSPSNDFCGEDCQSLWCARWVPATSQRFQEWVQWVRLYDYLGLSAERAAEGFRAFQRGGRIE